jgi:hypothetical protein
MYTWKCYKETPCVAIKMSTNKSISFFFFYKVAEQKCLGEGLVTVGGRGEVGREVWEHKYCANTAHICM